MKIIELKNCNSKLFDEAVFLFNEYRKFYKQESDIAGAKEFLCERISGNESIIFLALNEEGNAIGFMQIYHGFSSVGIKKTLILNDLYIDAQNRKKGVGRALIKAANNFALQNNIKNISLSTSKNNFNAQKLYEDEGYKKDEEYFVYNLKL